MLHEIGLFRKFLNKWYDLLLVLLLLKKVYWYKIFVGVPPALLLTRRHTIHRRPTLWALRSRRLALQRKLPYTRRPIPFQSEGYLDEQFCQVEDLQDEASPNFVEEVVTLFFKDSARLIANIEQALEKYPKDFTRWDAYMQQLKGSCSSIGASRLKNECAAFRDSCGEENAEGCMKSFQKVKREHVALRQKLESYFQLLRQASPAGTATRP